METPLPVSHPVVRPAEPVSVADDARSPDMIKTILRGGAIFLVFTLLTALLFRPWIAHLGSALLGPPEDNMQDFWNSWYAAVAGNPRDFFHTDLIRFPQGTSLVYHSFAYTQIFFLFPLTKLFGADRSTLVLLQNLTLLLSFPLAGTGAFYLVRHFVKARAASLLGGFVFAFNPSHVAHVMHHAHVASIEFIPFFVLAYLRALEEESVPWLLGAIVLYALCALSCWYYVFYIAFFIVFHTYYHRVRNNRWPRGWQLTAPLSCVAGTAVLLSPLIVPMILQGGGANTYHGGMNIFVADVAAYFAFPPTHLFAAWGSGLYARLSAGPWEGVVYLGLVNLALLLWLSIRTRLRDPLVVYVLCGIATFCLFASGESLHAFGHDYTFLPMPDILLAHAPFAANLRTPSRAIVMVYLFLAIGVGYAIAQLEKRQGVPSARILAAAAAFLVVLDFAPAHLAMTDARCPKGLDLIARDGETGFGVLNLPVGYNENNAAMFEATCHGRPVVGGIVARQLRPSLGDHLPSDPVKARPALIAAHVKYVVVTSRRAGLFFSNDSDALRRQYARVYRTVFTDRNLTILRVY